MSIDWDKLLAECVEFTQRLIQTPSMPKEEETIAQLIAAKLRLLNFDEVWLDEIGNVYGRIYGQNRELGAIVLNSHTDHVDPGDPALWPVPPYSGQIVAGRILGRGACDIKGPLAVQVYSMAALLQAGWQPKRDIVFTGVVEEEIGGAGATHWFKNLDYPVDLVVLGEPSSNEIALGHRGMYAVWVQFSGRSVHASVPHTGINPNYALATFLTRLETAQGKLSTHDILGQTTVAPTIIEVDTKSGNVTPAWTRVLLDFRTATESPNSLSHFISEVAGDLAFTLAPGWDGLELPDSEKMITGFYTPRESEVVQSAAAAIARGMNRQPKLTNYQFATDGRLMPGLAIIGYSPAEEDLAHTIKESISIEMMAESLYGHVQLLLDF